jgi:hypothetical protein
MSKIAELEDRLKSIVNELPETEVSLNNDFFFYLWVSALRNSTE